MDRQAGDKEDAQSDVQSNSGNDPLMHEPPAACSNRSAVLFFIILSVMCYVAALVAPVFQIDGPPNIERSGVGYNFSFEERRNVPWFGISIVLLGWTRFISLPLTWLYEQQLDTYKVVRYVVQFLGAAGWFANPLAWLSLILYCRRSRRISRIFSLVAFGLASLSLLIIGFDDPYRVVISHSYKFRLLGGSYVWFTSLLFLMIANLLSFERGSERGNCKKSRGAAS